MLQLKEFPDIPVSTREEARETRPHPEETHFPLIAREEGSFPTWLGKKSRRSRRMSIGGALHRKGERNTRIVPPFQESARCLSPCFPSTASTFKPRIDSHHGGTWDSPVGKPRWKASRECHRSLVPLEGKLDTAATSREESASACPHPRRGLTPLGRHQKYPQIHVSTGEES